LSCHSSLQPRIDRELYLPESWTADRHCRQTAGIGEQVEFHTKPQLAREILERMLDAQIPVGWATGCATTGCPARPPPGYHDPGLGSACPPRA
jgi:SRSO17 transposase